MESFMKETPVRKRETLGGGGERAGRGSLSTGVQGGDASLFPRKCPGLWLPQGAGAGK